jgi:ABC-type Fe3+/spermidine/putrescine transport system ATPase subunit
MSLELRGVTKQFVTAAGVRTAVDDVTLGFERGRFYVLLGPSGCGKTTLLRLLAGFEQPTRGEVVHDGRPLNEVPPYARGFPMVFQSFALFPHMTVADNVAYGLRVRRLSRAETEARVADALAMLGLEEERTKHPGQLSGGQQQRVALARCLVTRPDVILLDEPLSNLDAELRVSMRREIRALQRALGITAIHVTHDQEEAMSVADHVVVMSSGRVEQVGTPREVYGEPRTEFVARFMGSPNIVPVELVEAGRVHVLGRSYELQPASIGATRAVIRPDALRITRGGTHRGVVEDVTFLGGRTECVVRLGDGTRLTVEAPADESGPAIDDEVGIDLVAERLHLF